MRLAMVQMAMSTSVEDNLTKTLSFMDQAKAAGADLIFFPEIQLSPFFPQYKSRNAEKWLMNLDSPSLGKIRAKCLELNLWACPNIYLSLEGHRYDASLMIDGNGDIQGISKMVHIAQAQFFYEQDYYCPAQDGFHVFDTPFGRVGVVICFDRHIPISIRDCALQGAELILIPTANITCEPMELFSWEVRIQAFQNTVFIAMCNRVGKEGDITFTGESMAAAPDGSLLFRADHSAQLCIVDLPLAQASEARNARPWLALSRKQRSEA